MNIFTRIIVSTLIILSTSANGQEMGIVTGSETGTYIKIGKDISRLMSQQTNINLTVYPSEGSKSNVADVYERQGVQLAIVQSDVLSSIRSKGKAGNEGLLRIADKVKMVFPLYNEEVHILARNSISSFSDFEGIIVAVGASGSGTNITANFVFEIAGITPGNTIKVGGKEALSMLSNGTIDAMIYVSGYPVKLFESIDNEKVKLLTIIDKSVSEYYPPSTIPANTYPFQVEAVDTVAVKAVLMSYDYRRTHCNNVGLVAKTIYNNFDWLKQNGHSKWKSVDLDFNLSKWEQYSCVKKALETQKTKSPTGPKPSGRSTARDLLDEI